MNDASGYVSQLIGSSTTHGDRSIGENWLSTPTKPALLTTWPQSDTDPNCTPTSDLGHWLFERNIMLEYFGHAPHRIQTLTHHNPKAVRKLADLFARTNQHLEQTVGTVATTFAHYSGDHPG